MTSLKRPAHDTSPKYGGIPSKMPTLVRQRSPVAAKSFLSPPSVDPEPYYLVKDSPGWSYVPTEVTGETNLISHYGLEHSYQRFSSKKVKEQLSAFLPHLPGMIDTVGVQDNSSLRMLIDKPPVGGKEILPLSGPSLAGFKLHPGSIPEQFKLLHHQPVKKHKHKKHKKDHRPPDATEISITGGDQGTEGSHDKKHKKQKKHEDGERKKRKKEKKKKKRQSPTHPSGTSHNGSGPGRP
ncbi:mediator of RNA polymerase II transcription subunit 19-like isoform X2 [Asterias rubens]|uniref:mediator of RNA polymerase II transcription subunit 19-like isoform X2 n=1 Tax=Asterias rubens TaxID=7604 RepID=UPI001455464B|nr:mediator of RNA polymerase II transcription subunit 19-like isoform X2 [Asterias rubens]